MKTERELFEEWVAKNIEDGKIQSWEEWCWQAWQASANREGYKLVPVEPTQEMLEALESAHIPDYEGGMYCAEQGYKAMIGATP